MHLPQIKFDHKLILLKTKGDIDLEKGRPFRFLARWTKHATFFSFTKDKWNFIGCMATSLSDLTLQVKDCIRSIYEFIGSCKRLLLNSLSSIQKAIAHSSSSRLLLLEKSIRDEVENLLDHEEMLWK